MGARRASGAGRTSAVANWKQRFRSSRRVTRRSAAALGAVALCLAAIGVALALAAGPPSISITATPTVTTVGGVNYSNSSSASFSYAGSGGSGVYSSYSCTLDGGTAAACGSGASGTRSYTGLTNGSHTFSVTVTDNSAKTSTAATYTWTVDTVAPNTTISTAFTNDVTNTATPSIAFASSERPTPRATPTRRPPPSPSPST